MSATVIAVGGALLAALCFGVSSVLQHSAAARPGPPGDSALRLTVRLLARPRWLLGLLAGAVGLALQAAALHEGRLSVVQPLLATGLVFTLLIGAAFGHTPSTGQWLAAAGTVLGLAVFLLSAQPAAGRPTGRGAAMAVAVVATLVLSAAARAATRSPASPHRALLLGAAAGLGFGVTGGLLKQVVATPVDRLLLTWAPYALVAVGLVAVTLAQAAYAAGSLVESVPALSVLEPVVGIAVGSFAFAEKLDGSPFARVAQVVGIGLMAVSIVRLAALQARQDSALTPAG